MDDYDFVPKLKKKSSKSKEEEEFKGLLGDDDEDEDEEEVARNFNSLMQGFSNFFCLRPLNLSEKSRDPQGIKEDPKCEKYHVKTMFLPCFLQC